jgi:succinate dehydrogenase / fumarate reductase cytochrome b subunit
MWLINSSVGRKVIMSITGAALILFLTFHMAMNLVAVFSEKTTMQFVNSWELTGMHL